MTTVGVALYGHDQYAVFGAAAVLDLEKIPYRRVGSLEELTPGELLLVAGRGITAAEAKRIVAMPSLVLDGGEEFARTAFGRSGSALDGEPVVLSLAGELWSGLARRWRPFGHSLVTLPSAPLNYIGCAADVRALGALATSRDWQPAMLRSGACVWSTVDIGTAFARLLTESSQPLPSDVLLGSLRGTAYERGIQAIYYAAPEWMRHRIHHLCYSRAQRRLSQSTLPPSTYPADDTGSVLIEMFKGFLTLAGGALLRLRRWPAPFRSAALMTHDIEPSQYSYGIGLERLLSEQRSFDHPIFGLVTDPACRLLPASSARRLRSYDVLCHGLTHCGEPLPKAAALVQQLNDAKARLEGRLGRTINGYRSPRLDRSPDLQLALDASGFEYDSSFPDTDRENMSHFGAGVRLNIPYRAPISVGAGKWRPSRCLELPLAAPDCIQPLFVGESEDDLRRAVVAKADLVRRTEGVHVALVHAGVFGDHDAELRERHRRFVTQRLDAPEVWRPRIGELLEWWRGREELRWAWDEGNLSIHNDSRHPLAAIDAVLELNNGDVHHLPLPPLAAGQHFVIGSSHCDATPVERVAA